MFEKYTYDNCPLTRLGDIRVLSIQKGCPDDPIECTLTTRSLESPKFANPITAQKKPIRYEALSYHWGLPTRMVDIKIYTTGHPYPKIFQVRPDLYAALKQLRKPEFDRTLWIDAICIDQENTGEQNSQVSIMAEIYSEATHVCVWLGPESSDSEMALRFISRIVNLDDFDRLVVDPSTPKEWGALSSLMKRKWFSRRWVVQEIALAKRATLYCGSAEAEWSDFAVAVSLFETAETKGHLISKSIMNSPLFNHVPDFLGEIKSLGATRLVDATSNLFRKSDTGQVLERLSTLDALISNLSVFEASRAHDVIYAVLALAKGTHMSAMVNGQRQTRDNYEAQTSVRSEPMSVAQQRLAKSVTRKFEKRVDESRFTIDYDRPFFNVCKDFLTFTIHGSKSLDIICRPWVPVEGFTDGDPPPSWLLTMNKTAFGLRHDGSYSRKHADSLVGTPGVAKRNYSASGSLEVTDEWRFGENNKARSMYAEGFVIDEVDNKKPSAMEGIIPHAWLDIGGWTERSALPPDAFWRTLIADRGPNGLNPPAFYPLACKSALNKSVEGSNISTGTLVHNGKSDIVAEFLRRVHEVIWMKRLIKTKHELLGMGPDTTKRRDLICILYGCSVPVILRPQKDEKTGEEYFQFIGECYVHGIMDGEAFELARSRNPGREIDKKVFEIR